ncbi:cap-specific mRNA (nucleoside-2'-O-)-methyltransferase 1 [Ixodes scapularis]
MAASFKPASLSDSSDETDGDHEPAKKGHAQTAKKWNNEPNRKKRQLSQNESSDTDSELHSLKRVKGPSQNDGYKRPNALPKSRKEGDSFGFGREMDGDHEPAKRYNNELSRKRRLPPQTDVYKEPNAVPKSRSESDGSSKGSPTKFSHFMPNSSEDDDEDARNSEDGGDASNQIEALRQHDVSAANIKGTAHCEAMTHPSPGAASPRGPGRPCRLFIGENNGGRWKQCLSAAGYARAPGAPRLPASRRPRAAGRPCSPCVASPASRFDTRGAAQARTPPVNLGR